MGEPLHHFRRVSEVHRQRGSVSFLRKDLRGDVISVQGNFRRYFLTAGSGAHAIGGMPLSDGSAARLHAVRERHLDTRQFAGVTL